MATQEDTKVKESAKRSELAKEVQANMPVALRPLAEKAKGLKKVTVTDSPDAFGVIWESGDYLDPTDPAVQDLAVEAAKAGESRRKVTLALGFHRPSAYDRALSRHAKRGEAKATQAPKKEQPKAS